MTVPNVYPPSSGVDFTADIDALDSRVTQNESDISTNDSSITTIENRYQDYDITVGPAGDYATLALALASLPATIRGEVVITMEGDKDDVQSHTLTTETIDNNIVGSGDDYDSSFVIKAADTACQSFTANGSGTNYVTIAKTDAPGYGSVVEGEEWKEGDWAGAKLCIVYDGTNANASGDVKVVDAINGVITDPGDSNNWKFILDDSDTFTATPNAPMVSLSAVNLESTSDYGIYIKNTGAPVSIKNLGTNFGIMCGEKYASHRSSLLIDNSVIAPVGKPKAIGTYYSDAWITDSHIVSANAQAFTFEKDSIAKISGSVDQLSCCISNSNTLHGSVFEGSNLYMNNTSLQDGGSVLCVQVYDGSFIKLEDVNIYGSGNEKILAAFNSSSIRVDTIGGDGYTNNATAATFGVIG